MVLRKVVFTNLYLLTQLSVSCRCRAGVKTSRPLTPSLGNGRLGDAHVTMMTRDVSQW